MSEGFPVGPGRGRPWVMTIVVTVGLILGYAISMPFAVAVQDKALSGLEWEAEAGISLAGAPPTVALPLRLIDAGGVGIPADTGSWGASYSHATYAFDQLVTDEAPWLDAVAAAEIREDWRAYVRRMSALGANAVVLDAFLELVNFDDVGSGRDVYPGDDPLRFRHTAYRDYFRAMAEDAGAVGMEVYLKTDMPAVTPQLRRHLTHAPGGGDTGDPAFWAPFAAGFGEVFRTMPEVAGVVVRVGEAGPLFNADATVYESYMGVRTPGQLQTMLQALLPVFERHGRTLIFRSWSVGLGPLGDLHNDPEVYLEALGSVESPALVVSTKFVRGDYFGFLPLNPTLFVGRHRRIVEFQARREFEGFGALPNYLAKAHGEALRQVRAMNPHLEGISLWAQEGGPLRAGPLSLYDVTGFWRWTDANVYATLAMARGAEASPRSLARRWAQETFGAAGSPDEEAVLEGMADLLLTSREALEKAWYIRPYARRKVELAGIEVPPILWIFEWDVVGGWSSVLSTLYETVSDDVDGAVGEGYEAVVLTQEMAEALRGLEPALGAHPDYPDMLRSLEYQQSLFQSLADFRAAFLSYYRWLDVGGDAEVWRELARVFLASSDAHASRFQGDLDFPAMDFGHAQAFMRKALSAHGATNAARVVLSLLLLAVAWGAVRGRRQRSDSPAFPVSSALWLGLRRPSLLARESPGAWLAGAGTGLAATGGTAFLILAGEPAVFLGIIALGLGFAGGLTLGVAPSWDRARYHGRALAGMTPVVLLAPLPLAVMAVRGPDYFWYLFWSSDLFRAGFLGVTFAVVLATILSTYRVAASVTSRESRAAAGTVMATGVGLVLLAALLPDLEDTLSALDDPLGIFPMTHAIINAVTHYGGTPAWILWAPGMLGALLVAGGLMSRWRAAARDAAPDPT